MQEETQNIREKIDIIDNQLLELLNERAALVKKIGELKSKGEKNYFDPARQADILNRLQRLNQGQLHPESIQRIFLTIFSESIAMEEDIKIGYLGSIGSFTHQAAIHQFGKALEQVSFETIPDVFDAVQKKWVNYGVVPIENSTEGVVNHTLDMFLEYDLKIIAEILMDIKHHLISSESTLENIQVLFSHPQAFAQCRLWIKSNLPHCKLVEVPTTSEGVLRIKNEKNAAAIGSHLSAQIHNMPIIRESIQDSSNNMTRFLVIGNQIPRPAEKNKTSIMLALADKVGALFEVLSVFRIFEINLTKIESRPSKKRPWEYIFFIDFQGHIDQKKTDTVLEELRKKSTQVKILGSYPVS